MFMGFITFEGVKLSSKEASPPLPNLYPEETSGLLMISLEREADTT
jgi:hypothetical protein